MQLLGNLFEYVLDKRGEQINILGATSGDTGSAAEYAMRGKHGVRVFMLSPHGRMSAFQRAQMYSLRDENIFNIAVRGMFDDAQDVVKAVSNDHAYKGQIQDRRRQFDQLGARCRADRLLLQGLLRRHRKQRPAGRVRGAVGQLRQHLRRPHRPADGPAGRQADPRHQRERRARRVLPHRHLPPAEHRRDPRHLQPVDGHLKASNFERFVFDLVGRSGDTVRALWSKVDAGGAFDLSGLAGFAKIGDYGFVSGSSNHADRLATIRPADDKLPP